ncbi:unnamed protein product [Blepharisma stoltei]|uniref:Lariat debranching enzyme n=1 Tax=Blepharisma stoltei TaxID=1481888 RepID=A0AAU9IVH3_9CILI|nr:unnamed protein product [Blepharisma stoltei]
MYIAVVGCVHGELELMYNTIKELENERGVKADIILCTGDFEAMRNEDDLRTLTCPQKYRTMGDFCKYHNGEFQAETLTLFIGGNHEAVGHMKELPWGGWVAPNIYYMGRAGVMKFGDLRIAGISGIFHKQSYKLPLPEQAITEDECKSLFRVRVFDVDKLLRIRSPDIFLSHDWPRGIYRHGNTEELLKIKPFLKDEIRIGSLGSPAGKMLLDHLKPKYWFASHMHVRFLAQTQSTKFLALDKAIRGRRFVEILRIEGEPGPFEPDQEWLNIIEN